VECVGSDSEWNDNIAEAIVEVRGLSSASRWLWKTIPQARDLNPSA
jgi:hypothetical protein